MQTFLKEIQNTSLKLILLWLPQSLLGFARADWGLGGFLAEGGGFRILAFT
jgi:hypothetical protein